MKCSCKIIYFLFFLLLASIAYAQEYYADVIITVDETGLAEISGLTNHPELKAQSTHNFTSKEKAVWTLNITAEGEFSDFVYELRFPKDTVINYLKVPNRLSISEESGYLVVSGIGKNEQFYIIAQYSFEEKKFDFGVLVYLVPLLAVAVVLFFFIIRGLKKTTKADFNINSLTDRQREILKIVIKNKNGVMQSMLQKEVKLPKASLSRNIESLVRREILVKERKGMTNILYLNPKKK